LRVHRRRWRTPRLSQLAGGLAQGRLQSIEKLVHARVQPLVLMHQRIAHHDPAHARVLLGELQHRRDDASDLRSWIGFALDDLVGQREQAVFDEADEALEHLRLAGEVTVERGLADIELGGQGCGGDAFGGG